MENAPSSAQTDVAFEARRTRREPSIGMPWRPKVWRAVTQDM